MSDKEPVVIFTGRYSWRRVSTILWMVVFGAVFTLAIPIMVPKMAEFYLVDLVRVPADQLVLVHVIAAVITGLTLYFGIGSGWCFCKLFWFFLTGHVDTQLLDSNGLHVRMLVHFYHFEWKDIVSVSIDGRPFSGGHCICIKHKRWANMNNPYREIRTDIAMTFDEAIAVMKRIRRYARPVPAIATASESLASHI